MYYTTEKGNSHLLSNSPHNFVWLESMYLLFSLSVSKIYFLSVYLTLTHYASWNVWSSLPTLAAQLERAKDSSAGLGPDSGCSSTRYFPPGRMAYSQREWLSYRPDEVGEWGWPCPALMVVEHLSPNLLSIWNLLIGWYSSVPMQQALPRLGSDLRNLNIKNIQSKCITNHLLAHLRNLHVKNIQNKCITNHLSCYYLWMKVWLHKEAFTT